MADDFLLEFIDESQAHLTACEGILLGLIPGIPAPQDEINAAFRAVHTIKGGAGFLDQDRIQRLAHAGEQLFDALRSGTMVPNAEHIEALLATVTDLRTLLEQAQGQGLADGPMEVEVQIQRLKTLVHGDTTKVSRPPEPSPALPAQRSIDGWVGELTSADPADLPSLKAALEGLTQALGTAPGPIPTTLLGRMAQALQKLEHGDRSGFDRLLALAGDLLSAVFTSSVTETTPLTPTPPVPAKPNAQAGNLDARVADLLALDPLDAPALAASLEQFLTCAAATPLSTTGPLVLAQMRLLAGQFRTNPGSPAQASRHRRMVGLVEALLQCRPAPAAVPTPQDQASSEVPFTATMTATVDDAAPGGPSPLLDFMAESIDLLSDAERICLAQALPPRSGIDAIFRCFHTIKGMASYLAQPGVEADAHAIESRLLPLRDGERAITEEDRGFILQSIDRLRTTIACLTDSPTPTRLGDILVAEGVSRPAVEVTAKHLKPGQRLGEALVAVGAATPNQVEKAVAVQQAQAAAAANPAAPRPGADGFSRVATSKLEDLMNLVGELLISQSLIVHDPDVVVGSRLQQEATRQSRIIRDLQVLSLSLRMVPLRSTFQKLARAVHDTARKCGKDVDFQVLGEDTEVDRTLAETIADPLLHMVRNGVDHGIEAPDVRVGRNKPRQGSLRLSACHAGDNVVITLTDDGNGMDPARLRTKAIEKGLIPADAVLTDAQAFDLIFLPGFSTAAAVTSVSGRGVGMDVVRRAVEAAKGTVTIDATLGKGSTFTIRLPLTTAILDAMVLRSGDRSFLVPVQAIVEAVRPVAGQVQTIMGRDRVLQSRGRSIPLVHLGSLFGIAGSVTDPDQSILMVLEDGARGLALQVDDILGQQQVVIKPLSAAIPHHAGVSGTAILGDGRVGLILDPTRLGGT